MPWFPDFANASQLARAQTRAIGQADPVRQYFAALNSGDTRTLETVWPGEVVVYDPRAGEVRGHRRLREFVKRSQALLAERRARTETVAATSAAGRAVVELLVRIALDGQELTWPVAVVSESPDDSSVVFRAYLSQRPVDGRAHIRPPVLAPANLPLPDVPGRYRAAVEAGDAEGAVAAFAVDGYLREPFGPDSAHRGTAALREYFTACLRAGGIRLEHCTVTDDGVRCALEYNCVRWGRHDLPPQAGLAVYERGPEGLLAAVRVYDDIEPPGA